MTSVFDVAAYILHRKGSLSAMKLQKLCYYCQAWSLVWDDRPLFEEDFEAWRNGPVCRQLYGKTKGKYLVDEKDEDGNPDQLTDNQRDTIDTVLETYGDKNAQWLSRLTHLEDPWRQAREGYGDGEHCEVIITKESMAEYYGSL